MARASGRNHDHVYSICATEHLLGELFRQILINKKRRAAKYLHVFVILITLYFGDQCARGKRENVCIWQGFQGQQPRLCERSMSTSLAVIHVKSSRAARCGGNLKSSNRVHNHRGNSRAKQWVFFLLLLFTNMGIILSPSIHVAIYYLCFN